MKNILSIVLLFCSIISFGQRVLPTQVNNDMISLIEKEGKIRTTYARNTVSIPRATVAVGASIGAASNMSTNPGKNLYLKNIILSADKACTFAVTIKYSSYDATGQVLFFIVGGTSEASGQTMNLPFNCIIHDGGSIVIFCQAADAGNEPRATSFINAIEFTADMNFEANRTMLITGDSVTMGTMGNDASGNAYDGQWLWAFQLRDKLADSTRNTFRVVNRGVGGTTSVDWKKAIRAGDLDGIPYDFLAVSLGLNDAAALSGSYTIADFKANLKLFVTHRDRYRKNASILFLAPTPTDKTTMVSNIVAIRTAVSEVVTESGGSANRVYFVNQNDAFTLNATATADTNFTNAERSTGNRVHLSGLGHTLNFNNIWAVSKTWMFNNLK